MKRQSLFVVKFLKQYEQICPGITDSWYSKDVQEKFNSFKSKKCCAHECVSEYGSATPFGGGRCAATQKPTCFILFCIDRRKELQLQNPHVPNKQITSMLAKEWREHKQIAQENKTSNEDNIYNKYKVRYEKIIFFDKHKNMVKEKYPDLDEQEVEMALENLYMKYTKST
jgi:hypothetical protein